MKTSLLFVFLLSMYFNGMAQRACVSFPYQQEQLRKDPAALLRQEAIETFIKNQAGNTNNIAARDIQGTVIKIPVVVHVLYHYPAENISDAVINSQIEILNKSFRRQNADTTLTPAAFKSLAADCEIEFHLAISDPRRKNTSGIIRKYTPITEWEANDHMKYSEEMGSDAWDSKSYLNIWVCNLQRVAGYSSSPGADPGNDGIVLSFNAFGSGGAAGFDMGKTAVHEVGHWLNLRHIWGDDYCGDDGVYDTPKQEGYTAGCPTGVHTSCNNGPNGDMYMNYMDFSSDACLNLFTLGQKARMHALFAIGGPRNSLLNSTGLLAPLIFESPLPEEDPRWLHPQLYPNPTQGEAKLDLSYDSRWLGKILNVINLQGQVVMQVKVTSKIQVINTQKLQPGMYFLTAKKEDGDFIRCPFIRL